MRRRIIAKLAVAILTVISVALPQGAMAQGASSNMVFSPYTMYGIGDLIPLGTASTMSMGGIGLGMKTKGEINYLNPASLGWMQQRTALFSFGARGNNYRSETETHKTAYNNFDISDLGFAVPLYRGVGLSFSLTPVSAVGYKSVIVDETKDIVENIGRTVYSYSGEGGISQVSMGVGALATRGLTVGVSANYYFGNIDRVVSASVLPMLGQGTVYRDMYSESKTHVSHVLFTLGAQYSRRIGKQNSITVGVTFQPRASFNADREDGQYLITDVLVDTVSFSKYKDPMAIPTKIAAGVYYDYGNQKLTIGLDVSRQDWTRAFNVPSSQNVTLRSQTEIRLGAGFCPNRGSLGSGFNRMTYKAGVHYSRSYLMKNDYLLTDFGFSLGTDIPLKKGSISKISLGVDFGSRGAIKTGQVKENYFKIFAGLTLFGDDFWFYKQKFD